MSQLERILREEKKLHQLPQILKQENSVQDKSHVVDFLKISEKSVDYNFCERK